jgi:hypothetical protein
VSRGAQTREPASLVFAESPHYEDGMYTTTMLVEDKNPNPAEGTLRIGYGLKLPFRYPFLSGTVFRDQEHRALIYIHQDVDAYDEKAQLPFDVRIKILETISEKALSKVMVMLDDPTISKDDEAKIRSCNVNDEWQHTKVIYEPSNMNRVIQCINKLTCAVHAESKRIFGVKMLTLIGVHDFLMSHIYATAYFLGSTEPPHNEIANIFLERAKRSIQSFSNTLSDINLRASQDVVDGIQRRMGAEQHPFTEYCFHARTIANENPEVCLVFATMALENFFYLLFEKRVTGRDDSPEKQKRLIVEDFSKAGGFTALFRAMIFLVLEPHERPSDASIEACFAAISLRNSLVHSKLTRDGKLHHRVVGDHTARAMACIKLIDDLRPLLDN